MPESRQGMNTVILALVGLAALTVAGVVLVLIFVADGAEKATFAGLILSFTTPIVGFLLLYLKTDEASRAAAEASRAAALAAEKAADGQKVTQAMARDVGTLKIEIDGRMADLLAQAKEASAATARAAALIEGHAAGKASERALQAAREEVPPSSPAGSLGTPDEPLHVRIADEGGRG